MATCAIVIPVYKPALSKYEEISLRQCFKVLGKHQVIIVCGDLLSVKSIEFISAEYVLAYGLEVERFNNDNFLSISTYSSLLLNPNFYGRFKSYEYILIYQLDCFVFKDTLSFWLNQKYDFVGSPWLVEVGDSVLFDGVGNGGLSLRNVETFRKILSSLKYINRATNIWEEYQKMNFKGRLVHFFELIFDLTIGSFSWYRINSYKGNEDIYIGKYLSRKYVSVPTDLKAAEFSFERHPRFLFKINGQKLPFGCHAWWRYDLDFFSSFIVSEGYFLEDTSH